MDRYHRTIYQRDSLTIVVVFGVALSIEQVGQAADGREPVFQIYTPACDIKLRMTRSFGDFYLKQNKGLSSDDQAVVAVPEVIVHTRSARYAECWSFVVLIPFIEFIGWLPQGRIHCSGMRRYLGRHDQPRSGGFHGGEARLHR